jgi:hypothetical protein
VHVFFLCVNNSPLSAVARLCARRAQAYELLQRQQQLEAMLAEVRGQKEPELLLDTAESLLARMKAKLQKA